MNAAERSNCYIARAMCASKMLAFPCLNNFKILDYKAVDC